MTGQTTHPLRLALNDGTIRAAIVVVALIWAAALMHGSDVLTVAIAALCLHCRNEWRHR